MLCGLTANHEVRDRVGVALEGVARLTDAAGELHAVSLLDHVRRFVRRGVQVGRAVEGDVLAGRVGVGSERARRRRRAAAEVRLDAADVVPPERLLNRRRIRQWLRAALKTRRRHPLNGRGERPRLPRIGAVRRQNRRRLAIAPDRMALGPRAIDRALLLDRLFRLRLLVRLDCARDFPLADRRALRALAPLAAPLRAPLDPHLRLDHPRRTRMPIGFRSCRFIALALRASRHLRRLPLRSRGANLVLALLRARSKHLFRRERERRQLRPRLLDPLAGSLAAPLRLRRRLARRSRRTLVLQGPRAQLLLESIAPRRPLELPRLLPPIPRRRNNRSDRPRRTRPRRRLALLLLRRNFSRVGASHPCPNSSASRRACGRSRDFHGSSIDLSRLSAAAPKLCKTLRPGND